MTTISITPSSLAAYSSGQVLAMAAGRATANQSLTTQAVLQNATGFSFAINPSEEWLVQFDLDIGSVLSTTGLQIACNAPAGATLDFDCSLSDIVVTAGNVLSGTTAAIATAITFAAATSVAITNASATCNLWVLNGSTGGTIQLQFAQATSSGTALTIKKGSSMFGFRVA